MVGFLSLVSYNLADLFVVSDTQSIHQPLQQLNLPLVLLPDIPASIMLLSIPFPLP